MIPTSKLIEEETSILTIDSQKQYTLNISVNGVIKEIIHNGNAKYKDLKPLFGLYENRIIRDKNNKINDIISSDICYSSKVIYYRLNYDNKYIFIDEDELIPLKNTQTYTTCKYTYTAYKVDIILKCIFTGSAWLNIELGKYQWETPKYIHYIVTKISCDKQSNIDFYLENVNTKQLYEVCRIQMYKLINHLTFIANQDFQHQFMSYYKRTTIKILTDVEIRLMLIDPSFGVPFGGFNIKIFNYEAKLLNMKSIPFDPYYSIINFNSVIDLWCFFKKLLYIYVDEVKNTDNVKNIVFDLNNIMSKDDELYTCLFYQIINDHANKLKIWENSYYIKSNI